MRVAYFINQYPAVSHTFIRREIRALEALGLTVFRIALQPAPALGDAEDEAEAEKTRFLLKSRVGDYLRAGGMFFRRPIAALSIFRKAIVMGRHSDSGLIRHLVYILEAGLLADFCRRAKVQHIHAHFGTNSAAVAMMASQLTGIPYSFTAHGPDEFERAPLLSLGEKLYCAEFVVCVSSFGRSQFMRWSSPKNWDKLVLVHCGLDHKFFDEPLRPPPDVPRLVCIGTLNDRKGQLLLVRAASLLRERGLHCEIVIIGDGDMRPQIEHAIRQCGLEGAITLIGWASGERVRAEIEAARVMVLPSFSENLPVVLMEAMALGRPVISTYVAGIPELVEHRKTGWLVPAGDEVALAEAIREALTTPVLQLATMGTNGRAHVFDQHDIVKEATKLKRLFERSSSHEPAIAAAHDRRRDNAERPADVLDVGPKERLVLHFHGLGSMPSWISSEERGFWCEKDRFLAILDTICMVSKLAPIEVTFDDGNVSDASIALPALVERGLTATFFVCAGRLGTFGYLDGSALRDLISGGMGVGSHGWDHVDWRRVADDMLDKEVDDARHKIADIAGYDIDSVSIPFGSYDHRVLHRLERSKIKTVYTSDGGLAEFGEWLQPREVFKNLWNDDRRTLIDLAAGSASLRVSIRRLIAPHIKRLR